VNPQLWNQHNTEIKTCHISERTHAKVHGHFRLCFYELPFGACCCALCKKAEVKKPRVFKEGKLHRPSKERKAELLEGYWYRPTKERKGEGLYEVTNPLEAPAR
jgi:hypothetical protein